MMNEQNRWADPATGAPAFEATAAGADGALAGVVKADLSKRFIAAVIDAVIAIVVGFIPVIGGLIGAAYWLFRDGLEIDFMDRRSIGKKVMKLRPVRLDGAPMDPITSATRNWMFALGGLISLLLFIPIIGWLMMIPVALLALALGLFEIFKVVTDGQGRRLGDTMAKTVVVETTD
jgi:uncharacterized RDD family membrane protein YckC